MLSAPRPPLLAPLAAAAVLALACSPGGGSYTGDLPELAKRGRLRVLVRPEPIAYLPREGDPVALDREIAETLARELGLKLSLIVTKDYDRMVEKLLAGEADLISASRTRTKDREARTLFSMPYRYVDELLVTRKSSATIEKPRQLAGKEVCVRPSSSYARTLASIKTWVPRMKVTDVPDDLNTEEVVERVSRGECFATVVDSHLWKALAHYHDELSAPVVLAKRRPIALAMRPGSEILKRRINEILTSRALTRPREQVFTADLRGLKERRVLRMITRNNALTYFIHRGEQAGFDYELMRRFAAGRGLRLQIVIPPGHDDLLPWLNAGRGDVVAAATAIDQDRAMRAAFTRPYHLGNVVVAVREEEDGVRGPPDLNGRTIHVRKSSSFDRILRRLSAEAPGLKIAPVPEDIETETVLEGVEEGRWDMTLCDEVLLDLARASGVKLKAAFTLQEKAAWAWAVRKEDRELLKALDAFIKEDYRGLEYNLIKRKYFRDARYSQPADASLRLDRGGRISPYDKLAKKYADRYNLDWRLVVAQMYEESMFDPKKKSWAGAVGLMQLMPRTADVMGVKDIRDPEQNIHGGVKYMDRLMRAAGSGLELQDRISFALASYNAGPGHLEDARRLAVKRGLSPKRWAGNVETAFLLLQKPEHYKKARYGYCRGFEAVRYVQVVQDRYAAYVQQVP